jgi:hypothetical protein
MTKIIKKDRSEPIDDRFFFTTWTWLRQSLEELKNVHNYDVNEMLRTAAVNINKECREHLAKTDQAG